MRAAVRQTVSTQALHASNGLQEDSKYTMEAQSLYVTAYTNEIIIETCYIYFSSSHAPSSQWSNVNESQ